MSSPMTFCTWCHGRNIAFERELAKQQAASAVATRTRGFGHGIVFSEDPVSVGEKVCVEIREVDGEWTGAIRYGFTNTAPGTVPTDQLPAFSMPNLSSQPSYWARALNPRHNVPGFILSFFITKDGEVYSFVNNEAVSCDRVKTEDIDVSKPIWVLLDVFGRTRSIALKKAQDGTPAEILARGPDAMSAFRQAATNGTKPVFRTRLMLIGQNGVGKTSLRKSLLGQKFDPAEVSTDGIDTTYSCEISSQHSTGWKESLSDTHEKSTKSFDESSSLQETYSHALALNIARVLWKKKRKTQKGEVTPDLEVSSHSKEDSKDDVWMTSATDTSSDDVSQGEPDPLSEREQLDDLARSLDEGTFSLVTSLVEKLLIEADEGNTEILEDKDSQHQTTNIKLSIWDFAGQPMYHTTHQIFLSSRALYIVVFNLTHDLDAKADRRTSRDKESSDSSSEGEPTNLELLDFWVRCIHAHTAENKAGSHGDCKGDTRLSPPIFIVGTHSDGLSADPDQRLRVVKEKFDRIQQSLAGKPHSLHVIPTFYAIANNLEGDGDEQLVLLRKHLADVAASEPYMGEHIPLRWLQLQQSLADLVAQGINYMSLDNVSEVAAAVGVMSEEGLQTVLGFLHDLGVVVYYGGRGGAASPLKHTVILNPQWLADRFCRVITSKHSADKWSAHPEAWTLLAGHGILQDSLLDAMWPDSLGQKGALVGFMEKFDLVCERRVPGQAFGSHDLSLSVGERTYYVPSQIQSSTDQEDPMAETVIPFAFYITFNGFLPESLFHSIVTRAVRWSQIEGDREARLFYRQARFYANAEHDVVLEMSPARLARIKINILQVVSSEDKKEAEKIDRSCREACAKVRHFLDSSLYDLRQLSMRRISYQFTVACPCSKVCLAHSQSACGQEACQHFLSLDQCLANKVLLCESRQVRTKVFQQRFPSERAKVPPPLPVTLKSEDSIKEADVPSWVRVAAKLLNSGAENADWLSLAHRLGYKKAKIQKLTEDKPNPALVILLDWIQGSGNTALSVEMLLAYLQQMKRDDVIDVIQKGQDVSRVQPKVFISYSWGVQEEVTALRDHLERAGFPCWMDIGQMGGGDFLYHKIYQGIHQAQVFLCCITPEYIVSETCNREVSLADQLKKPIIPIIFKPVPWPPPSGLALIVSQLIYVTFVGVGGHGGSGVKADLHMKYQDVVTQMVRYTQPLRPEPAVKLDSSSAEIISLQSPREDAHTALSTRSGTVRSPSRGDSQRTGSRSGNSVGVVGDGGQQQQAPRVAVTKCAICSLL